MLPRTASSRVFVLQLSCHTESNARSHQSASPLQTYNEVSIASRRGAPGGHNGLPSPDSKGSHGAQQPVRDRRRAQNACRFARNCESCYFRAGNALIWCRQRRCIRAELWNFGCPALQYSRSGEIESNAHRPAGPTSSRVESLLGGKSAGHVFINPVAAPGIAKSPKKPRKACAISARDGPEVTASLNGPGVT